MRLFQKSNQTGLFNRPLFKLNAGHPKAKWLQHNCTGGPLASHTHSCDASAQTHLHRLPAFRCEHRFNSVLSAFAFLFEFSLDFDFLFFPATTLPPWPSLNFMTQPASPMHLNTSIFHCQQDHGASSLAENICVHGMISAIYSIFCVSGSDPKSQFWTSEGGKGNRNRDR